MAKYIIDLPDDTTYIYALKYEDSKCVDLRPYNISDLAPYTEPDKEQIENEAWEFVMKCLKMDGSDFYKTFDSCDVMCLTNLSYQEAKSKYDAWLKQKDEVRVGDEVIDKDVVKAIVINIDFEVCSILWLDGSVSEYVPLGDLHKTGRHFDEVEELLKKIREE